MNLSAYAENFLVPGSVSLAKDLCDSLVMMTLASALTVLLPEGCRALQYACGLME